MEQIDPQHAPARADTGRLAALPPEQCRRFRDALAAAGFLPPSSDTMPETLELRARGGSNLPRLLCGTAAGRPLDIYARLFLLGVPVPARSARAAMAPAPLEEWIDAGLVELHDGEVSGLLAIYPFEGLLLAFDRPELLERGVADRNYVAGPTNSTLSMAAFMVRRPFHKILDLGTGCGVLAFFAARVGERVLATDVNPRAIQFAQFSARLNGITNVEFAAGGGFEPAGAERFDQIIANPPCVLGPAARYTFRDSGEELDGLGRKLAAAAPDHLEPGGIFQCSAEWPNLSKADWRERVSDWFRGVSCDALVLHTEDKDTARHAEETVCETDVLDAREQERLYLDFVNYFAARNVTSISEGLMAVRPSNGRAGTRLRLENMPGHGSTAFGDAVWNYFEAADALDELGDALADAKPRMAAGLSLTTVCAWNGRSWDDGTCAMRQAAGFEFEATVDGAVASLVRRCDGTRTARELIGEVAASARAPFAAAAPGCLEVIRQMLLRGFLVLTRDGE